MEEATAVVMGFANLVDNLFVRYTGKTLAEHLQQPYPRTRVLPGTSPQGAIGEASIPEEIVGYEMPLADAYAILGLKPDAPLDQVKKNYRNLAKVFHSDKGGMNDEAMKLLNRAYDRITKGKG